MRKQITIPFEGKEYILEYTRSTVQKVEARGFSVSEIDEKPATNLPLLFEGAFLAHHPSAGKETVEKILETVSGKKELFLKLAEMYVEPIKAMMDDPEGSEGNANWAANW